MTTIALIGGVYNNYLALEAACKDALLRGANYIYCLGDLGAFGPSPDKVFPILENYQVITIQGNYDNSIGNDLNDCQCGYTDPEDNYFARLSYEYTKEKTSLKHKAFLKNIPPSLSLEVNGINILLCHGSPRRTNEFLWESTTPTHLLEKFCRDHKYDVIAATHTGIHWQRQLADDSLFVNVGVVGRPENDGKTNVWYTLLKIPDQTENGNSHKTEVEFIPLEYDYQQLATEMSNEGINENFIDTILNGWWTTCLEILPHKERLRGKF